MTTRDEGRVGLESHLPPDPAPTSSAPALLTALCTAASVPPSLGPGVAAGESESGLSGNLASLRDMMHKRVDDFCDKMRNEPEGAQMEAALAEMEEELSEDISEFIEDHIQENLPESSPFLPEARQEVRRRIQRPSVSACPEVQNPQESIWARALRWFEGILQRLKQRCWDALTWLREKAVPWLKEKAAACLEAICSAVKAVWGMLTDFCSTVGQLFRILIQV